MKIIQEEFWGNSSQVYPSLETSTPLTQPPSKGLTSSQVGSHANPSVLQGSKEARKMTVGSGRKCSELLSKHNPLMSLLKMLLVSSTWHSMRCYLTWKPKSTAQGRLYFQLAAKMPSTGEKESGSLPKMWGTPTANDSKNSKYQYSRGDKTKPVLKLPGQVQLWPTPSANQYETKDLDKMLERRARCKENSGNGNGLGLTLANAARMWPTPSTRDHKGGYQGGRIRNGKISMDTLDVAVQATSNREKTQASLNPEWVSLLMGYPRDWTCVEDGEMDPGKKESPE